MFVTSQPDENSEPRGADTCKPDRRSKTVRFGVALAFLVGVGISASLIAYHNFSAVVEALHRLGWKLGIIIAIYFLGVAINSFAWLTLFRSEPLGFIRKLFVTRWIRESINYLLPSAVVGGDIVGIRLLVARGCDASITTAVTVADKTLEAAGLFFFVLAGIFILLTQGGNNGSIHWAIRGLAAISAMLIVFLLAQRWGLLRVADKAVSKLVGKCGGTPGGQNVSIHNKVWELYADGRRLSLAILLHVIAWMPGVTQVWLTMRFMGHDITWQEAFIIESLTQMACAVAFIMPASLGAQEAAYMTMGMLFGISPPLGLALSLVQRLKDVSVSIIGLLVWQGFEGRGLWAQWKNLRRHQ
jgi:putative membrane protein